LDWSCHLYESAGAPCRARSLISSSSRSAS
jgi:hypothetical protein